MYRNMMLLRYTLSLRASVAVLVLSGVAGCGRAWRPSLEAVRTNELPTTFSLSEYLPYGPDAVWVYDRSTDSQSPDAVMPYRCLIVGTETREGCFADGMLSGLSSRLIETDQSGPDDPARNPSLLGDKHGFILTFEPAAALYPETFSPGEVFEAAADIHYFDRTGRHQAKGTATRRVHCEGVESVTTPAGAFEDCLRLRIEMKFHLHWGPTIETTEYCWLARHVGLVRRIERITGIAWIFLVNSTTEYVLAKHGPRPSSPTGYAQLRLRCTAVALDRWLPHPTVGGMFHELVPASASASAEPPVRQSP